MVKQIRWLQDNSILLFLSILFSSASFYIRFNYMDFVEKFGTYQGDLWYFFNNYGSSIANFFFFPVEYPVGYVLLHKLTYFISNSLPGGFTYENFIWANAFIMIPLTIATVFLSIEIAKKLGFGKYSTAIFFLLSPTFFIASSTNYDIFPVFFVVSAIYSIINSRFRLAFLLLAVGTVIKLFPGFLLVPFILYSISKKRNILFVIQDICLFIFTVLIANLPFLIYNYEYWLFPYQWQSQNPQGNDPNTISFYLNRYLLGDLSNLFLVVVIIVSWIISWYFWHKNKLSTKNFILLCYFTCFSAVFGNHVNTPQYLLWFLPFVAMFHKPKYYLWIIFDITNASILYTYFKLTHEYPKLWLNIFNFNLICFILMYIYLFYLLKQQLTTHHEQD